MPARHFDLGADEAEPITFTWEGETYRLRGSYPALIILRGMRARLDGTTDEEVSDLMLVEFLEAICWPGEEKRLLATGISYAKVLEIIKRYTALFSAVDADEDAAEGEAMPPTTGASIASEALSNDSPSSKPTSSASTGSTSGTRSAQA